MHHPALRGDRDNRGYPWLLVFDLDGTLIDSSRDLCASVNAALAEVGAPELPGDTISGFIGDGAGPLVQRALAASGCHSPTDLEALFAPCLQAFLDHYRLHKLDTTQPYPGVVEALRTIRSSSPETLMAVLTNKPVKPSREICEALGLASFFFANYGGDSFTAKKPHPVGLQSVLREATLLFEGRRRESCPVPLLSNVIMVGDSDADILVGRACGVRTAGCGYGLTPEAMARARPDMLITNPSELSRVLGF